MVENALVLSVLSIAVSVASVSVTVMIYLQKKRKEKPIRESAIRASEYKATVRNAELANKDYKIKIVANWLTDVYKELHIASAHVKTYKDHHGEPMLYEVIAKFGRWKTWMIYDSGNNPSFLWLPIL